METSRLKEVALVFLKIGFISFGGPAAHVALMEKELVLKRKWMTEEHYLDLIGATNLVPGPNGTEIAMHCGHERAGTLGLFVAGICFILPAALMTGILAYIYKRYDKIPEAEAVLYGIKPAMLAIILKTILKLGSKFLKNYSLICIGIGALVFSVLGFNEIYVLFGSGLLSILWFSVSRKNKLFSAIFPLLKMILPAAFPISSGKLFLIFLKIGATLFGSGYVLIAYLDAELIARRHLISRHMLIDAVAIGQFTPGPLFSTATFIGYQLQGFYGAVISTIGIFLPSFFFVLLLNPLVPRLRSSPVMGYFLDGVSIGAISLMAYVTFQLGEQVLLDWRSWLIGLLSLIIVFVWKRLNAAWIVLGGALAGYLLGLLS